MSPHEIYDQFFNSLFRFYYYKGVPKDEVEDLIQELFLRYFRKYTSPLDRVAIRSILYAIARNIWREWVREKIRTRQYSLDELVDEGTLDAALFKYCLGVGDSIDDSDLEYEDNVLSQALSSLSERHRLVLELRFINGWSREMVGKELGISEKDVHTYQKRAIKALRDILNRAVPPSA